MKKTMRQSLCMLLSVMLVLALLAPGAAAAGDGVFYTFPEAGIAFLKVPEGMTLKVEDMHDGTTGEAATNAAAFTITDASGDEMLLVGMGMPNQRLDNADESVNPVTQEELVLQLMHDMEVYQDITSFSQMTDEDFTAMVDDYEELAVMLQRFARSRGYAAAGTELVLDAYKDQDQVSSWAADAMRWAVSQKLITGMTADTLVPAGTTTRAQLAVILMRYLDAEPNFAPAPEAEIPAPAPAETETVAGDAA